MTSWVLTVDGSWLTVGINVTELIHDQRSECFTATVGSIGGWVVLCDSVENTEKPGLSFSPDLCAVLKLERSITKARAL